MWVCGVRCGCVGVKCGCGGLGVGVRGGLVGVCFDHEGQVQNCLYLAKTFVVKTLHYSNLLCYNEKYLASLLTFTGVAMSLYHVR